MSVYVRGQQLWIRFRDAHGRQQRCATGYRVGEEAKAEELLAEAERAAAVARAAVARTGPSKLPTLRMFAVRWLEQRKTETVNDDRGRIYNHILPELGAMRLDEIRPRHVREFIKTVAAKRKLGSLRDDGTRAPTEELLAPRTVRHVYGTLHAMLHDAVADELIAANPCELKRGELPAKADKDRTWRRTAVFTRDEVEAIISAPDDAIPEDRRVMYALMFLGAMRFGEAAALTWRDYDPACAPLGKLVVEKSYSSKSREVKGTKTDNPREMPTHPTLAKILATWKLDGFARLTGHHAQPEDLIVPSRRGAPRNANHMLRRFHEDLDRIGLRARRQHDARRTFISIALSDGARKDMLRWVTHGPSGDVMDSYTTPTWAALCAEVAKARIGLREGRLIEMPMALVANGPSPGVIQMQPVPSTIRAQSLEVPGIFGEKWRSGRDLNPRPPA